MTTPEEELHDLLATSPTVLSTTDVGILRDILYALRDMNCSLHDFNGCHEALQNNRLH